MSGLGEFSALIAEDRVRALAISSTARLPGVEIPTLREQGVPLDVANWRGLVAPPGITPARRAELVEMLGRLARSPAWKAEIARRGWVDLWLPGEAFERFLAVESRRVAQLVAARRGERLATAEASLTSLPATVVTVLALLLLAIAVRDRRRGALAIVAGAAPHEAERARLPAPGAASQARPRGAGWGAAWRLALIASGMLLDVLLIDRLGFVAAAALLFALSGAAFGERRPVRLALGGVTFAGAVYLVFHVGLDVPLPAGTLGGALR